jgi:hypothetical protein
MVLFKAMVFRIMGIMANAIAVTMGRVTIAAPG